MKLSIYLFSGIPNYVMNLQKIFESVLNESKEHLIRKNELLTDEQKKEMLDFFYGDPNDSSKKAHANLDSKIDWNKKDTVYNQFQNLKNDTFEKSGMTIDFLDYTEGQDYEHLGDSHGLRYYVPYNYNVQKDVFQKNCPKRWCIGWNQDAQYWHNYTSEGSIFLVVYSDKDNICIQYHKDNGLISVWNKQDKSYGYDAEEFIQLIKDETLDFDENSSSNAIANNPNDDRTLAMSDNREFAFVLDENLIQEWMDKFDEIHREIESQDDYEEIQFDMESVFMYLKNQVQYRLDDFFLSETNIYCDTSDNYEIKFVFGSSHLDDADYDESVTETFNSQRERLIGQLTYKNNNIIKALDCNIDEVNGCLDDADYFEFVVIASKSDVDNSIEFVPHLFIYHSGSQIYSMSGDSIEELKLTEYPDEYLMDRDVCYALNQIEEYLNLDE